MGLGGMEQDTAVFLCSPLVLFDMCMYTLAKKESYKNKMLLRKFQLLCLTSKCSIFLLTSEWNVKAKGWSLE